MKWFSTNFKLLAQILKKFENFENFENSANQKFRKIKIFENQIFLKLLNRIFLSHSISATIEITRLHEKVKIRVGLFRLWLNFGINFKPN